MAYYNYKRVRDCFPKEWEEKWEASWKEETGEDYEDTCDYDGDLWIKAHDYIEYLENKIKTLESK